jgi:hypothetical protein
LLTIPGGTDTKNILKIKATITTADLSLGMDDETRSGVYACGALLVVVGTGLVFSSPLFRAVISTSNVLIQFAKQAAGGTSYDVSASAVYAAVPVRLT